MRESKFQKKLIDEIKEQYPECVIMKNDSGYIQGIPDWTILYKNKWAVLEAKKNEKATARPNQPYYVKKLNGMSYANFVYPENKDEVMRELESIFKD